MKLRLFSVCAWTALFVVAIGLQAAPASALKPVACEGIYKNHLQGVCTDGKGAIFWSWTTAIVRTDLDGRIQKSVPVPFHHGDLCFVDGKLYVAVNLGKFNEPAGTADSWVFVYDAATLGELSRHRVPELVHGAGGMDFHNGRFLIIGGLPPGVNENYLYEYDAQLKFQKRHVLPSGYTEKGIQTVKYADGSWWFGCYGKPKILLRADEQYRLTGRWEFDASFGIIPLGEGRFLIAESKTKKEKGSSASLRVARTDSGKGMVLEAKP